MNNDHFNSDRKPAGKGGPRGNAPCGGDFKSDRRQPQKAAKPSQRGSGAPGRSVKPLQGRGGAPDRAVKSSQGRGGAPGRMVKPPQSHGEAPRRAALKALQDVVRGDAYAAQALDRQLEAARLSPEDRRLAASIFYFAVENRLYIETMLDRFMETKAEPVVNDILHIAAAQLLFMDRVPDHAAVDEAVKQVRFVRREGLTGLVNAVLRSLIRARDAGELTLPDREAEPVQWLSVKHSVAPAIAERLITAYGIEEAEQIASVRGEGRAQTVRPNRMRMDPAAFERWLDEQKYAWRRGLVEDAYVVSDAGSLANTEGYRRGLFSIQGESAMLAALAVGARPGVQILDACAAPGGKTALMAERMMGAGRVYAWDVHEHRVRLIRAAAQRLGLDNVRATVYDARHPMESARLAMDAVLVDAPCSGLGVIAEKPDIKYRVNAAALDALPPLQRDILDACCQAVKVGGRLVYATCTVLPEENEKRVRAFLEAHPEFEPETDGSWLPEALRPHFREGMIQILPHRDGIEGFFIARLVRKGV